MLFFKKRRIKIDSARLFSIATHPSSLKLILLSLTLSTAFLFRTWSVREEEKVTKRISVDEAAVVSSPAPAALPPPASTNAVDVSAEAKINLNRASAEEIETLPGVGPKLAGEILAYREQGRVFRRAEDLLQVKGIGPKRLKRLEPFLTFEFNGERERKKSE